MEPIATVISSSL